MATSCEELTHWKRLCCWEGLGARGEGDDRGWDSWMASPTRWAWVRAGSGSWWWTGKPSMLQSMGRKESDMTEQLNWTDANRQLIGKVPDAGSYWGQKEKRVSEDEMAGQHHQCNKNELGQIPGGVERLGGLVCCSPWGHKQSDTTGLLNNNNQCLKRVKFTINKFPWLHLVVQTLFSWLCYYVTS